MTGNNNYSGSETRPFDPTHGRFATPPAMLGSVWLLGPCETWAASSNTHISCIRRITERLAPYPRRVKPHARLRYEIYWFSRIAFGSCQVDQWYVLRGAESREGMGETCPYGPTSIYCTPPSNPALVLISAVLAFGGKFSRLRFYKPPRMAGMVPDNGAPLSGWI